MTIEYYRFDKEPQAIPTIGVPKDIGERFGRGLGLPLELIDNGHWNERGGVEKIRQSILITLLTPIGVRMLQPDFGSLLPYMVMEHWTSKLQREMIREVKACLAIWVKQIIVETVTAELDYLDIPYPPYKRLTGNNIVIIKTSYLIKGIGTFDTVVIPLSRDDGVVERPPSDFTVNGRSMFRRG